VPREIAEREEESSVMVGRGEEVGAEEAVLK